MVEMIRAQCPACRMTLPIELFKGERLCQWCAAPDVPHHTPFKPVIDFERGMSIAILVSRIVHKQVNRRYAWSCW